MTEEKFLTIEEVAERLRVSDRTVRRWIDSGRLHAYKPGGDWRIRASDLAEFLETSSHPKTAAPPRETPPKSETEAGRTAERAVENTVRKIRATLGDYMIRWSQETPPESAREVATVVGAIEAVLETPELREAVSGTPAAGEYSYATLLLKKLRDIAGQLEGADAEEQHAALREVEEQVEEQTR